MRRLSFTWFGHATFMFHTPGGKRILVDPWLTGNPVCPVPLRHITELDLILLTHGHHDHAADVIVLARSTAARVIAPYELSVWLERKGVRSVTSMNQGGSLNVLGLSVTMVTALHSS
jgi:L-ascorbate metabolism protein UlaG (beta-lactamase superfamily)